MLTFVQAHLIADIDRVVLVILACVQGALALALAWASLRGVRELLPSTWARLLGHLGAAIYIAGTELNRLGHDVGYWRLYVGDVAVIAGTYGLAHQLARARVTAWPTDEDLDVVAVPRSRLAPDAAALQRARVQLKLILAGLAIGFASVAVALIGTVIYDSYEAGLQRAYTTTAIRLSNQKWCTALAKINAQFVPATPSGASLSKTFEELYNEFDCPHSGQVTGPHD